MVEGEVDENWSMHVDGSVRFKGRLCVPSKVFKGESVRRGVFVFVRRGVSLEALRRKLFEPYYI